MKSKKKMGQVYTMIGGPANAKGMDGEAWVRGVPREVAKEYETTFGDHPSFVKTTHEEAREQWKKLAAAKTERAFVLQCSKFAGTLLKKMQEQREAFHKNRTKVAGATVGAGTVTLEAMKMDIPGYEPRVPAEPGPEPKPEPEEEGDKDQDPDPGIDADVPPEEDETQGGGGNAG